MKKIHLLKKILLLFILTGMMSSLSSVYAQKKEDWAVGGSFIYGHEDAIKNYGIGLKGQYNVSDPVRLEGQFMHFFKKNYVKLWSFSMVAHYLFPLTEQTTLYPLVGAGYIHAENTYYSKSKHGSDPAFYMGGGLDHKLAENVIGNVELKYEGADNWNRLLLSVGIMYRF